MRKLITVLLLLTALCCPDALAQHKKAPPTKFDEVPAIEPVKEYAAAGIRNLRQIKLTSEGGTLDTSAEYLLRFDEKGRLLEKREYAYAKKWIKEKPDPPFDQFDYRIKRATLTTFEYDAAGNIASRKIYQLLPAGSSDAIRSAFRKTGRDTYTFWSTPAAEREALIRPFLDSLHGTAQRDELLPESEETYSYDPDGNIRTHMDGKNLRETHYTYQYTGNGAVKVKRSITRRFDRDPPRFNGREIHYTYAGNSKPDSTIIFTANRTEDTISIAQKNHLGFKQLTHYNKEGLADRILDISEGREYRLSYTGSLLTAQTLLSIRTQDTFHLKQYAYNGTNLSGITTWHFAGGKRTIHSTRVTTNYNARNLPVEQTTEEINQYNGGSYSVEQVLSFYGNAAEDAQTAGRRSVADRMLSDYKEGKARTDQEEKERRAAQLKALVVSPQSAEEAKPVVKNGDPVLTYAERMPEFDGDLQAFLAANLEYPESAKDDGSEGRVTLQFIVQKDGSLVDIVVKRSSGVGLLDKEALRVIRAMPKWIPGRHGGKPVNVYHTLPITFRLG